MERRPARHAGAQAFTARPPDSRARAWGFADAARALRRRPRASRRPGIATCRLSTFLILSATLPGYLLVALPKNTEQLRRTLRLPDLVLLNITAVVGVRWLAVAAHTGPGSITLWVSAGLLFFIPSALVVAGLSKRYPEEGGLYVWTREAFGPWHGFLCGACYFVSNLFYLPSALLYGLSIAAEAFGFSQDKALMIGLALAILWSVAIFNLLGAELGKWTSDMGGIATILVGALLMAAGWFAWRHGGSATPLHNFVPRMDWGKLNFWSQIALGFTGLELGAIMAGEIRDPSRTIPRAAWISGLAVCAFYVGGTLAGAGPDVFGPGGHYLGRDASGPSKRGHGWGGLASPC